MLIEQHASLAVTLDPSGPDEDEIKRRLEPLGFAILAFRAAPETGRLL
jgi:hypothetical protein